MGLFNNLMSKIFTHPAATRGSASQASAAAPSRGSTTQAQAVGSAASSSPAASPPQTVDVAAVLNDLARNNSEQLDWRRSIVDFMKLVGIDSSLSARKKLATELHYSGDLNDSASMTS